MKIESLKELQKLIDLCHKNNIMAIEVDGIKLDLGARPLKSTRKRKANEQEVQMPIKDAVELIATNALSPEELLLWSSRGPEEIISPIEDVG